MIFFQIPDGIEPEEVAETLAVDHDDWYGARGTQYSTKQKRLKEREGKEREKERKKEKHDDDSDDEERTSFCALFSIPFLYIDILYIVRAWSEERERC